MFVCPLNFKEMTGMVPFVYLSTCGCVFSQAGLKAVSSSTPPSEKGKDKAAGGEGGAQSPSDGQLDVCPQCAKKYSRSEDVRMLNPGPEEEERMRSAMDRRRATKGKGKKRKAMGTAPEGAEGEQPPSQKKKSGSRSGSSTPLTGPTIVGASNRAVASSLAMEEAKRKAHMSEAVKSLYRPKDGKARKETFMTMGTFTRVSQSVLMISCDLTRKDCSMRELYCTFTIRHLFLNRKSIFGICV
jgi:Rtf2 RING-finger